MTFETVANIVAMIVIAALTIVYHYGRRRFTDRDPQTHINHDIIGCGGSDRHSRRRARIRRSCVHESMDD